MIIKVPYNSDANNWCAYSPEQFVDFEYAWTQVEAVLRTAAYKGKGPSAVLLALANGIRDLVELNRPPKP